MNILLLSSIYPADDIASTYTPVAHYFAKEWLAAGHDVRVINSFATFPSIFYTAAKIFGAKALSSYFGFTVMTRKPKDREFAFEGVPVARFCIPKFLPHRRYAKKTINRQFERIVNYCNKSNFTPDVIVGHWLNPQLELINLLSKIYPKAKTALTLHEHAETVKKLYPTDWKSRISSIGKIGARNHIQRERLIRDLGLSEKDTYLCLSGIPESFLEKPPARDFSTAPQKFAFAGTLIRRKHPLALLQALLKSGIKNFQLTYAGSGECERYIRDSAARNGVEKNVRLLGKIPRMDIKKLLRDSDCFAMISKSEIFGLVYLEAMALGCLTIASKNEGFDGIIRDGENGFLCEAGNSDELSEILKRICNMSPSERRRISAEAVKTAEALTDKNCALNYLNEIKSVVGK